MNPEYVLPSFLGACLVAVCIWNVRLTGKVSDLKIDLEWSEERRSHLQTVLDQVLERNDELRSKNERLLNDVTKLAVEIPKRDDKGRFRRKC